MKERLVYGLGINDSKCVNTIPKGNIREYTIWQQMLFRCTEQGQAKNQSYSGCTVSILVCSYRTTLTHFLLGQIKQGGNIV